MTSIAKLQRQYEALTRERQGIAVMQDGEDWWAFGDAADTVRSALKGATLSHSFSFLSGEPAVRFHRADFDTVIRAMLERHHYVYTIEPTQGA